MKNEKKKKRDLTAKKLLSPLMYSERVQHPENKGK